MVKRGLSCGLLGAVVVASGGLAATGCGGEQQIIPALTAGSGDAGAGVPEDGGVDNLKTGRILTVAEKVDLLLMVDNSIGMADKHELLERSVAELISRLVNPFCVDSSTGAATPVPSADASCPAGFAREFAPVSDLHIGVISSSVERYQSLCNMEEQQNDRAHLIGARPRALSLGLAATPEGTPGFVDWNPAEHPGQDVNTVITTLQSLISVVGEGGCGFESSLEAWYRFLIDPLPPESVVLQPCSAANPAPCAVPTGIDSQLLAQRSEFLRGDSLVLIVMLTDENDCSLQNRDQLSYIADPNFPVPAGSSACSVNPNDPCCYNCALGVPPGCSSDPACAGNPAGVPDPMNLRCWDQKRRFGVSFLYPTERYVNALTQRALCTDRVDLDVDACTDAANVVPNPLFVAGEGGSVRGPGLVFLAGIVGVPWQDLQSAVDEAGNPIVATRLRYKSGAEMRLDGTWDVILGEPDNPSGPIAPLDPLMIESLSPRGGTNPITGSYLEPPGAGYLANPINGHEWANPEGDDLQYACIFPLAVPRACEVSGPYCECGVDTAVELNPLCQAPGGNYEMVQSFAKAYPSLRLLQVLRGIGDNAVVASVCARNVADVSSPDYGYRPAVGALFETVRPALQ